MLPIMTKEFKTNYVNYGFSSKIAFFALVSFVAFDFGSLVWFRVFLLD